MVEDIKDIEWKEKTYKVKAVGVMEFEVEANDYTANSEATEHIKRNYLHWDWHFDSITPKEEDDE